MRIVFVSPGISFSERKLFESGGTESVIYGISNALSNLGHDMYILGRFDKFQEKKLMSESEIHFINIKVPNIKDEMLNEVISSLIYSRIAAKVVKKINPEIISLNERFSAYFPSKLNIPKTFTTHNPDAMMFYKDFALRSNRINYVFFDFKRKIEESVLQNSNAIIALNKSIKDYLSTKNYKNIYTTPNGIDVTSYKNLHEENFILYAGRLSRVKGLPYLIQAFSEIHQKYEIKLLIIGSGPEEKNIKKQVKDMGIKNAVNFIPLVKKNRLKDYLSRCSIFVLPSFFETFGIVVIEAMASGKPVIASDIPGPQDIITHGYDGFLFQKGSADELKKYLTLCLNNKNLRKAIGRNARKTAERRYTFEKVAHSYLEVYEHIRTYP